MSNKTTMIIHCCKAEFTDYVRKCLNFIGSGSYYFDKLTHTFSLNVSPHHKAMLRDFIVNTLTRDTNVMYKPEKIVKFNLNAENLSLEDAIKLAE